MNNDRESWLCSYSSPDRLYTIHCTSRQRASGHRDWFTLNRVDDLSDPQGDFVVFAVTEFFDQSTERDPSTFPILKIEIKADEFGSPISLHSSFNDDLLGSPTLFGPPELFGRDRHDYVWITNDEVPLWTSDEVPTRWESRKYH